MMLKRKKSAFASAHPLLRTAEASPELETDFLLDNLIRVLANFGFQQIFPPSVEERRLYLQNPLLTRHFSPQILELTGLPDKELVLNPTYFFSVLKRYLGNWKKRGPHVAKWFYVGPLLGETLSVADTRHELGVFILGEDSSLANAQLINTVSQVFKNLGVKEFLVEINSLGCKSCQDDYQDLLREHLKKSSIDLCAECVASLEEDVLTVWGCPNSVCQTQLATAPQIVDFLDESCRLTLVGVLETLDQVGIPYTLNPILSSALLQEKLLFRIAAQEGARVLGIGGNYSSWSSYLGNQAEVPLLGFLTTLEKIRELLPPQGHRAGTKVQVFLVPLGEVASRWALVLHQELQQAGITVAEAMLGRTGIRSQLKEAADRHSDIALIIGQKEAIDETVILRDIRSGMQEVFAHDRIIEEVKKRLGG